MLRQAFVLIAMCAVSACGASPAADDEADRTAIAASTAATAAAENAGDASKMRTQMAEDVIMLAPNMPAVAGIDEATAAMQGFFDTFSLQIEYASEEIVVEGDLGYDRGTYRQTMTPKAGGAPMNEAGKYLWVYRRDAGGDWKQSRVIWNSNDPLPGAAGA